MTEQYGITRKSDVTDEIQRIRESIVIQGYCIVENVFTSNVVEQFSDSLDSSLVKQESQFSREDLARIKEEDLVRAALAYDPVFLEILRHPLVKGVTESLLGNYFILHLQNGVINRPIKVHHQVSWHRDLPYQDFVSTEPLGINAFVCVDEFSATSGGTFVLPFSHKIPYFPSEIYGKQNQIQVVAKPGSVFFFDSMLYHKAGLNTGSFIRRGINTMFVRPILKQQIDLPELLAGKHEDDPYLNKVLGYDSKTPKSVEDFRRRRIMKTGK